MAKTIKMEGYFGMYRGTGFLFYAVLICVFNNMDQECSYHACLERDLMNDDLEYK